MTSPAERQARVAEALTGMRELVAWELTQGTDLRRYVRVGRILQMAYEIEKAYATRVEEVDVDRLADHGNPFQPEDGALNINAEGNDLYNLPPIRDGMRPPGPLRAVPIRGGNNLMQPAERIGAPYQIRGEGAGFADHMIGGMREVIQTMAPLMPRTDPIRELAQRVSALVDARDALASTPEIAAPGAIDAIGGQIQRAVAELEAAGVPPPRNPTPVPGDLQ